MTAAAASNGVAGARRYKTRLKMYASRAPICLKPKGIYPATQVVGGRRFDLPETMNYLKVKTIGQYPAFEAGKIAS
jgi:hypothetical protein